MLLITVPSNFSNSWKNYYRTVNYFDAATDTFVGKSTKRGLALINPFPRRAVYF